MGWDVNRPTIEDKMSDVPSVVQGNFEALQNAMSGEHAGIGDTSSVSGRQCSGGYEWRYEGYNSSLNLFYYQSILLLYLVYHPYLKHYLVQCN